MRKKENLAKKSWPQYLGLFLLLLMLSVQMVSTQYLQKSGNLVDLDSIAYSIETDAPLEDFNEGDDKLVYSLFLYSKNRTEVAIQLNNVLLFSCGRANVPHFNQARYILFRNPKFDCVIYS